MRALARGNGWRGPAVVFELPQSAASNATATFKAIHQHLLFSHIADEPLSRLRHGLGSRGIAFLAAISAESQPGMLIWMAFCQEGRVKRRPQPSSWPPLPRPVCGVGDGLARVSWRRLVSLKYAGWLPQDGVSSDGGPLSIHERDPLGHCWIAHSILAGHRQLARLTVSDRTSLDVSRGWPIPPERPTTSTSRPTPARSRCWPPRGV